MTEILSLEQDRESALARAAEALRGGRLVVLPTDTVYGIVADAFNVFATTMVFDAKTRPRTLALPVLVRTPAQAWGLCASVPASAVELAELLWPGPLTLVLPQAGGLAWDLGDDAGRVAVRVPDHADLLELISRVGPLAGTSANLSGRPTPRRVDEIAALLGERVDLYLDGGPAGSDIPSTIVDLTGEMPKIVREGAIPASKIDRITSRP